MRLRPPRISRARCACRESLHLDAGQGPRAMRGRRARCADGPPRQDPRCRRRTGEIRRRAGSHSRLLALVGDSADGYPGNRRHRRGDRQTSHQPLRRDRGLPAGVLGGAAARAALLFKRLATLRTGCGPVQRRRGAALARPDRGLRSMGRQDRRCAPARPQPADGRFGPLSARGARTSNLAYWSLRYSLRKENRRAEPPQDQCELLAGAGRREHFRHQHRRLRGRLPASRSPRRSSLHGAHLWRDSAAGESGTAWSRAVFLGGNHHDANRRHQCRRCLPRLPCSYSVSIPLSWRSSQPACCSMDGFSRHRPGRERFASTPLTGYA